MRWNFLLLNMDAWNVFLYFGTIILTDGIASLPLTQKYGILCAVYLRVLNLTIFLFSFATTGNLLTCSRTNFCREVCILCKKLILESNTKFIYLFSMLSITESWNVIHFFWMNLDDFFFHSNCFYNIWVYFFFFFLLFLLRWVFSLSYILDRLNYIFQK